MISIPCIFMPDCNEYSRIHVYRQLVFQLFSYNVEMAGDALLFTFSLIDCLFLLFLTVYFVSFHQYWYSDSFMISLLNDFSMLPSSRLGARRRRGVISDFIFRERKFSVSEDTPYQNDAYIIFDFLWFFSDTPTSRPSYVQRRDIRGKGKYWEIYGMNEGLYGKRRKKKRKEGWWEKGRRTIGKREERRKGKREEVLLGKGKKGNGHESQPEGSGRLFLRTTVRHL